MSPGKKEAKEGACPTLGQQENPLHAHTNKNHVIHLNNVI